jgi:hypothetical protein
MSILAPLVSTLCSNSLEYIRLVEEQDDAGGGFDSQSAHRDVTTHIQHHWRWRTTSEWTR